jgi:hypothetical protein
MDERLKALKSLQQVICVVAAAVLAFAVTPDRSKEYRAALDELEVFRKVDLKTYPEYVKGQFAPQEDANRALLLSAAKQAHLIVRSSTVFSEPFVMEAPPLGAYIRLRDFENFVTAQHVVGVYLVNDEREVFARLTEQLKQKPQQPVTVTQPASTTPVPFTVTGIYATYGGGGGMAINNVQMADPVVLHNSPNVESLQFLLFNGLPMPPAANFSVTCTFKASDNLHLALDWLRSDENGKNLIDPKSGVVFPKLKPFWERIADMGTENATLFLQERIEASTHGSLSLFGVSVDRDLVLMAGPGALFAVLLFFWLHLRQVSVAASWNQAGIESTKEYPWIVCFGDWLSGVVSYGCLIVLPVGSSLLLLLRHGESADDTTRLGVGVTVILAVVAYFSTIAIHEFRKRLRDGERPPNSGPGTPVKGTESDNALLASETPATPQRRAEPPAG